MSSLISSRRRRVWLRRLSQFFTTTVIGGVVVVLPMAILYLLVRLVFLSLVPILEPIGQVLGLSAIAQGWFVDLLSLGVVITGFFLLGLMVRTRFGGRFFQEIEEKYLYKLPLYSVLRETIRQFTGNDRAPFSQVVLVDVYSNDTRMIGFVTEEMPNGRIAVFVPTGPNPTNGFIFIVRPEQLEYLDVKPEEAMRTVIGLGVGAGSLTKNTP
jgi:uncharacterized membrane protein